MNSNLIKRRGPLNRRGFVITDAVIGIGLLGTLMIIVAIATGHDLRATRSAAEHRELTFAAEAALIDRRTGWQQRSYAPGQEPDVEVTIVSEVDAPEGQAWARIVSRSERQSVVLYGLVPVQPPSREGGS